ncbi:MAG TPA: hypothetical protein VGQ99_17725, partial [Tepidisphaeraceae bacterium]|nr:hypothetical protein [Tepidisphaeraceae bacterium]
PGALLWWLNLYNEQGNDHRFSPILANCQHLLPTQRPTHPLPHFSPSASPTTPHTLVPPSSVGPAVPDNGATPHD